MTRTMTHKILVIDDEDGIREIIQFSLEAVTDWEVLTANSGQTGIEQAIAMVPDAMLLDVMMPGMDGIETLTQIQAHPSLRSRPVILLTAKAAPTECQQLMQLGVAGVIVKPFKARELVAAIRSMLEWP